ncbi:MAG: hypothetical protein RI894_636 [Bacteroidota bacterium]|jgi:hypothetical protein
MQKNNTTYLYRPVNQAELDLIEQTGWTKFPLIAIYSTKKAKPLPSAWQNGNRIAAMIHLYKVQQP